MTINFRDLAALLQELEDIKDPRATAASSAKPARGIIEEWFAQHESDILRHGESAVALLSSLLPERLPHRVYDLRENRLAKIFGRALGLGGHRMRRLTDWQTQVGPGMDFAQHVESIMAEAEASSNKTFTLDEVDAALVQVAANSKYAGPKMKLRRDVVAQPHELLGPIITSLRSHEAKWLIRLILKDLRTVQMPETAVLAQVHFLLPDMLAAQNDLEAAVEMLAHEGFRGFPSRPDITKIRTLRSVAATRFKPQAGVMLTRQPYDKARSVKHCVNMTNKQCMSVERKYDGEYCQIHITRESSQDRIQIFSKSGKDSTLDREALHPAIRKALRFDSAQCRIRHRCILEGELLIWNSSKKAFEPFHKIRRYVKHGGKFLGAEKDSPRKADEAVMIVFYDILLLDNQVLATKPHEKRRSCLKDVVARIPGVSEICWRELVDFGKTRQAVLKLQNLFARSIQCGWEGFVLKRSDDPYYNWTKPPRGIKLKRDYLQQLGDSADLCIIGARTDSRVAASEGWNVFYIACLEDKDAVERFGDKPSFRIIDTVSAGSHCIPPTELEDLKRIGRLRQEGHDTHTAYQMQDMTASAPPTVIFKPAFVVECLGSGYDRNSGCNFWTLRFPRITKVHYDRAVTETISFADLQEAAKKPLQEDVDDTAYQDIIKKLVAADGKVPAGQTGSTQSTSPAKTPRSIATASISPLERRKLKMPPPLIRVDTAELNAVERRSRNAASQTTESTLTPSTIGSNRVAIRSASLPAASSRRQQALHESAEIVPPPSPTPVATAAQRKRKAAEELCGPHQPKAAKLPYSLIHDTPRPRVEVDLTQPSPSSEVTAAVQAVLSDPAARGTASVARRRTTRRPRGLTKTPPWCAEEQCQGSRILAELPRRSPSQRMPAIQSVEVEGDQHEGKTKRKSVTESIQEHPKEADPDTVEDWAASLLTPPPTEEAALQKRAADALPASSRAAILLSRTLKLPYGDPIAANTVSRRFDRRLAASGLPFAYEKDAFLRSRLLNGTDSDTCVIVDSSCHKDVAEEIWELGMAAVKLLEEDAGRRGQMRIKVYDWRVLAALEASSCLKAHFICQIERTPEPDFEPEHCAKMSDQENESSDDELEIITEEDPAPASASAPPAPPPQNPPAAPSQPTSAAMTAANNDAAAQNRNKAQQKEIETLKGPGKMKGQFTMQFAAGERWEGLRPYFNVEIERAANDCATLPKLFLFLEAASKNKYQECIAPHSFGRDSHLFTCTKIQLRCLDELSTFLDAPDEKQYMEWLLSETMKGSRDFFARVDVNITQKWEVMEKWKEQGLWVRSLACVRWFGLNGVEEGSDDVHMCGF
ncbi:DNA ligase 4 [Cyphellophora attinorum]|uniref:DNA ligase 4 n=1 Tax=Cyphellophora attinorum TaxID=1664694 RepID=A0A0N1HSU1_9EURO|nr:DNA ligase 4 [Phialophora attinorum]KPI41800.1 DNA ligase 4 [Phialophora attinorum]